MKILGGGGDGTTPNQFQFTPLLPGTASGSFSSIGLIAWGTGVCKIRRAAVAGMGTAAGNS